MDAASLAAVSIVARWCALCSPGTPSAHTKRQGWYVDIWSREREQDRLQIVPNVCIVYRDGVSESQLDAVGGHSPVLPERLFNWLRVGHHSNVMLSPLLCRCASVKSRKLRRR